MYKERELIMLKKFKTRSHAEKVKSELDTAKMVAKKYGYQNVNIVVTVNRYGGYGFDWDHTKKERRGDVYGEVVDGSHVVLVHTLLDTELQSRLFQCLNCMDVNVSIKLRHELIFERIKVRSCWCCKRYTAQEILSN